MISLASFCQAELIDTLWNVNVPEIRYSRSDGRINRYIMECKCGIWWRIYRNNICELIDTLWNVNDEAFPQSNLLLYELIDTLWNVNWNNH